MGEACQVALSKPLFGVSFSHLQARGTAASGPGTEARYLEHKGERPMAITRELKHAMAPDHFTVAAVVV
jgi:hypothetical protein